VPIGQSFLQDMSTVVKGDSTPLNEAPIRWWGGRRGWLDDWDNVVQHSQGACDPYAGNFSDRGELNGAMGMGFVQHGYGNPLAFREPFGHGGSGSGAFLDEEIRASFDGVGGADIGSTDSSTPNFVYAPTDVKAGCGMEGIPVPLAVPMPMAPGVTRTRLRSDSTGYGEVDAGPPPVGGGLVMQKIPDNLSRSYFQGNLSGVTPDGTVSGCFLLVALVVDATSPLRCLYKVRSSGTADMNTLVGAVVDSAMRQRARRHRTSRAYLVPRSHSHIRSWCPRRNRTQALVLPCARSVSELKKRNARAAAQERFGDGGTRGAL
jgi:hypothetical protein